MTRVVLANGTTKRIGEIVNNRLPVEVLSYDARKRKIVPRKVIDWHKNGVATEFLKITVEDYAKVGNVHFFVHQTMKFELKTDLGQQKHLKVTIVFIQILKKFYPMINVNLS